MADFRTHPVFLRLTTSQEANFLGTWVIDDVPNSGRSRLEYVVEEMDACPPDQIDSILATCQFLTDYPFPELEMVDDAQRPRFALAMAQAGLLTRIRSENKNAGLISALAVLFGTEYRIDLDESVLITEIPTLYGIGRIERPRFRWADPKDRFMICPELAKMASLSLTARRLFINLGYYKNYDTGAWIRVGQLGIPESLQSIITELCEVGIIDSCPGPSAKLTRYTIERLQTLAEEVGIKYPPKRKNDLIATLIEQCATETLERTISDWEKDLDLQWDTDGKKYEFHFKVTNYKGLRYFLYQEINRLKAYLQYIAPLPVLFHSLYKPSIPKAVEVVQNSPSSLSYYLQTKTDPHQQTPSPFEEDIRRLRPGDLKSIKRLWDKNCQAILEKVIRSEVTPEQVRAKSFYEVIRYFEKTGSLQEYRLATQKEGFEHNWRAVLNIFISTKLRNHKYYQLLPKEFTCPGCGVNFLEWSVPLRYAMLVQMNIQFCAGCYGYIFDHYRKANNAYTQSLTDKEMLERLFQLSAVLEMIPTKTFMNPTTRLNHLPIHLPDLPTEKQIAVGKALIQMPAYSLYVTRFGDWMTALVQSGVLADGHQVMSRGIRCIAKDGHVCLSLGEKAIDDWLLAHGIPHEKEILYPFDSAYNPGGQFRMDWRVGDIFIEYAGMMTEPDYRKKMDWKVNFCARNNYRLILLEPKDLEYLGKKLGFLVDTVTNQSV
ncbi:MAG: Rho termination factor N-terminal domain-containing protein [Anaerolineaceae bacterium]|nr:Rho termination factor N-terminal domain-containing protein [Anaerolineaceae bacterium]